MDLTAIKKWYAKNQFTTRERVLFYQEVLMGIEDGVSFHEIISDIHKINIKKNNAFSIMTREWMIGFSKGQKFSESAVGWIPDNELFLIAAGEDKDKMHENFSELIRIVTEQEDLIKSVKGKIFPQIFMLISLTVAIYAFSLKLAPGFKKIMPESQWPQTTRMYFEFSDWYVANGHFIIIALIVFFIISFATFSTFKGKARDKFDKFPPWSIYKKIQAAQFLIVVSGMVKSGIALVDILKNLQNHASPYLSEHLKKMQHELAKGVNDGNAIVAGGLLEEDLEDRIINYSKRSSFHKGILSLGVRASKEMIEKIDQLATRSGAFINYGIYLYVGFTIASLSEMVSGVIANAS